MRHNLGENEVFKIFQPELFGGILYASVKKCRLTPNIYKLMKFYYFFLFFVLQFLLANRAFCEKDIDLKNEFQKSLVTLVKDFSSGNFSRAAELWELRRVIYQYEDLKAQYSHDRIFKMLCQAADLGDPTANYYLVLESKEDKRTERDLERLKIAHNGGVNEASLLLALCLAFEKNRFDAAQKIAQEYFDRNDATPTPSEHDFFVTKRLEDSQRKLLLEILSGRIKIAGRIKGEDIFSDARLVSAWNSWRFPPIRTGSH